MPLISIGSLEHCGEIAFTGDRALCHATARATSLLDGHPYVMSRDVRRPHDKLFRTVFSDHAEAAALLRAHLPESLAGDLQWSSLTLEDASFVDDRFRDSESDLLYAIERKTGDPPVWLYVLLEHQSRADRWMPIRLLKYCCRIWDRSRLKYPAERQLRAIVPIVFYQGRGRWRLAAEFAELFAASVREWPWVPRFSHMLVDQSQVKPARVRGALRGRIAQLMLMAPFRHRQEALRRAAQLLAVLLSRHDVDAVRTFVMYLWATQDGGTARRFGEDLREAVSGPGGDMTTYAEELIQEGERKGRQAGRLEGRQEGHLKGRVDTIEDLLRAGVEWPVIEAATGIDRHTLHKLKQRTEGTDNAEA